MRIRVSRRGVRALGAGVSLALIVGSSVPLATSSVAADGSSVFHTSRTISRIHLVNGADVVADSRTFQLDVDKTTGLRDHESINVSWSGAIPTTDIASDPSSPQARDDQNPVVLLQCRGTVDQVNPETCWTQTAIERYITPRPASLKFPPWRVDRYATATDRQAVVDAPTPYPAVCQTVSSPVERWLPFTGANGTTYPYGPANACAGSAPESAFVDSNLSIPGNATYATTRADGTGSAKFDVWSDQTNASLGCSSAVPCSLVVVPIEGISCDVTAAGLPPADQPTGDDATAAADACQATALTNNGLPANISVTGGLWWSASNWRNRVAVPLSMQPDPIDCSLGSAKTPVDIYGSELLIQATQSWTSKACVDPSLSPFKHIQTGEPQARNLLGLNPRGIDAAFVSNPPDTPYPTPTVNAPVAFTGFAIGFTIDDADGHEYTNLKLTPRLLAKLLTESYPGDPAVKAGHLSHNPLDMSQDPEFIALNPGIPKGGTSGVNISASTLFALSSDSDVMYALTSYITVDPEARAWLDGQPDPWGMTVNPAYWKIQLPVQQWPLLDTYEPTSIYNANNLCLQDNPVPYLPLIASPVSRLATISLATRFAIAPSQTVCVLPNGDSNGAKLVPLGRQQIGSRFMVAVVSLADAARYRIDTAALQTKSPPDTDPEKFDTKGRMFIAPTTSSLKSAATSLKFDDGTSTWPIPYSAMVGPGATGNAYPGAMVVYAEVPTQGLDPKTAASYANVLKFLATSGQVSGTGQGQLPDGYLPLTSSNGLGALSSYTIKAATAVHDQIAPLSGSGSGGGGGSDSGFGSGGTPTTSSSTAPTTVTPSSPGVSTRAQTSNTVAPGVGFGGLLLPLVVVFLLLALGAYPTLGWVAKRRLR